MLSNIAQLEFVLHDLESIPQIVTEVYDRAKDGKRSVLVVRIYDTHGALSLHVSMIQHLRVRSEAFLRRSAFSKTPFWWNLLVDWRRRRLAARILDARSKLLLLAQAELRRAIQGGQQIGIEDDSEAPLRLARQDELQEMLEAAGRARSVRAFIFRHNDLLADRNRLVAYYIF